MTRIHKGAKEPQFVQVVAAVLFLAACAYAGAWLLGDLRTGPETAIIRRATVTNSLALEGIAVRREQLVCSPGGRVLAEDGQRLRAGAAVAETKTETIQTPSSVLFYTEVDGLEALSPDGLEALSVPALERLLEKEPETTPGTVGRLVTGCDWYFAALVPEGTTLEKKEYTLCFAGINGCAAARLVAKSPAEEGKMALLFRLTQGGRDYLSLRKTQATLILSEVSGLDVPEEAVRMDDDGREFVYTLTAGEMEKTAVEIIYRAEGRCIAAASKAADGLHEGATVALAG